MLFLCDTNDIHAHQDTVVRKIIELLTEQALMNVTNDKIQMRINTNSMIPKS